MAIYKPSTRPRPIEIDKFLGLNESIGETEVKLGEAVRMENFRITSNYKVQNRPGMQTLIDYGNTKAVQGLWYGSVGAKTVLVSVNNSKAYEYDFAAEANTEIGTFSVDAPTTIFWFEGKLYFLNGADYKEYNGTTFQDVDPYIPTIAIGSPPAGGGTLFEEINLLTGKKKQEFVGNGTATTYQLAETGISAATVLVTINGTSKTEGTHFTVNRTNGTVDFAAGSAPSGAPVMDADVIITWEKVVSGHADMVRKCRYAIDFGPGNDTAIFMWGNPDQKNYRRWSGTLRANYFPVNNFTKVGSDDYAITDIVPQYSRQIIFKENRTYYSYPEYIVDIEKYDYPVYDLNEAVGHIAPGQAQLVENYPVSLKGNAIWRWTNTSTEDERNAGIISERIRNSLQELDLKSAITFDHQKAKEYWLNVGSEIFIWNYGNDTFYKYSGISGQCYLEANDTVYCGKAGAIDEISESYLSDNGMAISKVLELGFTDFNVNHLRKNSRKLWLTIQPDSRTSVGVRWQTDKKALPAEKELDFAYNLLDFGSVDFGDFTFLTNRNPQPFRAKIRAKKYAYIKFLFSNNEPDETLTILSLKVMADTTSEVK